MNFELVEHSDPRLFCKAVIPSLLEFEAEYCHTLGLAMRIAENGYAPISVDELDQPLLLTVERGGQIEVIAMQTHKTKMLVTRGSNDAMRLLGESLASRLWGGREIIGFYPSLEELTRHYALRSGRVPRLRRRLRTFRLTAVNWPKPAAGAIRLCTPKDRHVLARFLAEFSATVNEPSEQDYLAMADQRIAQGRFFFWMDQQPVAMAGWGGRTPHGIRITWVYTPPEFQGRGYASNLVASLSQRLLDEGRQFCFLNTDLSNPTSNSIYQKIGYQPVCDCENWEFGLSANG